MSRLYDYFKKLKTENKMVQSFLIGNTTYDQIKNELKNIFEQFIFENKIVDIDNNPDIYLFNKDNLSKNEIKNLLQKISSTSQFSGKKIYIIDECENMNDFVYNSLLKTLEEPEEEIYAFLITKNINNIKSTISSRCQKIFISMESENKTDSNFFEIAEILLNNINKNGINSLFKNYDIYKIIETREALLEILKNIENILFLELKKQVDSNNVENENLLKISKKILITNNNIDRLKNYLNKNTCIDRFIIEMWRSEYENSSNRI